MFNTSRKKAESAIEELLYDFKLHDITKVKKEVFIQESYTKWAVSTILKLIRENETTPPILIAQKFSEDMDIMACSGSEDSICYSIAYDTAMYVMDLLLCL